HAAPLTRHLHIGPELCSFISRQRVDEALRWIGTIGLVRADRNEQARAGLAACNAFAECFFSCENRITIPPDRRACRDERAECVRLCEECAQHCEPAERMAEQRL